MIIDFRKNIIIWCSRYNKSSHYNEGHIFRQNIFLESQWEVKETIWSEQSKRGLKG